MVRWTTEPGGQFVMAGDLTLADEQRDYFLRVLDKRLPDLAGRYWARYPPEQYGPTRSNWRPVVLRLKELCEQYGISDCLPRPIIPGGRRTLNKLVVEALANQVYYMELIGEPRHRVWAYCKAAWAIEDPPQYLSLISCHGVIRRASTGLLVCYSI